MNTRRKNALEDMAVNGGKTSMAEILRRNGYSESYARNPQKIARTKAFNEILGSIDDGSILEAVMQTALDRDDKRAHLQAAQMIFNLKDRFPAGKLKVQAYNDEVESLKSTPNLLETPNNSVSSPETP